MGWFGKKKEEATGATHYVMAETGLMPIAHAVPMNPPPMAPKASAPPAPQAHSAPQAPPKQQQMVQKHSQQIVAVQQKQQYVQQQQYTSTQPQPLMMKYMNPPRCPMPLHQCPGCGRAGQTRIRTAPDWLTWISVLLLVFLFWPLCWVPLVTDSMRRTDHFCINCGHKVAHLGSFQDCCVKNRT